MMKLYKEEGVIRLDACRCCCKPFLIMLYGVIKGLANSIGARKLSRCRIHPTVQDVPRSRAVRWSIKSFGMDLNLKLFSVHSSFLAQIPFILFVLAPSDCSTPDGAVKQPNRKTGQRCRSTTHDAEFLRLIFAYFYMLIPAAVVLYMIISTLIRI